MCEILVEVRNVGLHAVAHLNPTPIFVWYKARAFSLRNEHHKDACYDPIGVCGLIIGLTMTYVIDEREIKFFNLFFL